MSEINNISLGLTTEEWKQVGAYANSLIQNDMAKGKFQNNESGLKYKSTQYKIYKNNQMRRLAKGEGKVFSDKSGSFFGTTHFDNKKAGYSLKNSATTGKRLKAYAGKTIESTTTAFVDMTLTGTLKKGLHVVKAWLQGVECGYRPGDHAAGKIEGNRKLGREVLGLSDENVGKVKVFIDELIRKRVKDFNQKINIDVKF